MDRNRHHRALFKYDEVVGYRFRPNLYVRITCNEPNNTINRSSYLVTTNSLGGRTRHEPDAGRAKKLDILVIGCSFAAGDGVSNEQLFSEILEANNHALRCHNYALSGSGNDQQYLIHREIGGKVRPDILVVAPYVGCIERNLYPAKLTFDPFTGKKILRPKPYFKLEHGSLQLCNVPVPRVSLPKEDHDAGGAGAETARSSFLSDLKHSARAILPRSTLPNIKRTVNLFSSTVLRQELLQAQRPGSYFDRPDCYACQLLKELLVKTLEESSAAYKYLLPLPDPHYYKYGWPPNYLPLFEEVARRSGATCLNVLPEFLAPGKRLVSKLHLVNEHFSEFGHQVLARFLESTLKPTAEVK